MTCVLQANAAVVRSFSEPMSKGHQRQHGKLEPSTPEDATGGLIQKGYIVSLGAAKKVGVGECEFRTECLGVRRFLRNALGCLH
jgi:hypothetical protein